MSSSGDVLVPLLLLLLGIALLYFGGEWLVDGASNLAERFGVSSLVIGLTVVAFGTSAPELAATLTATLDGAPALGFANVVGSNIANVGLILGVGALVTELHTTRRFILRELPFMILVGALLFPLAANGVVGRLEGAALFGLLLLYLSFLFFTEERADQTMDDSEPPPAAPAVGQVLLGVALLVGGAKSLVAGGVQLAEILGISERIVGLTMVSVGTSLPELSSSIAAARRGEGEMVLGNVVGSNVFNVLCILGLVSAIHPVAVDPIVVQPDLWVMLGLSILVVPAIWFGRKLGRRSGSALLLVWVSYIAWLFVS